VKDKNLKIRTLLLLLGLVLPAGALKMVQGGCGWMKISAIGARVGKRSCKAKVGERQFPKQQHQTHLSFFSFFSDLSFFSDFSFFSWLRQGRR
jgi:hypothetical protein